MITPEARRTLLRAGAALVFVFVLVWLMRALESVTTMVLVSLFIAYVLDPLANRMQAWRIPRSLAALILLLMVSLAVVLIFLIIVPTVVQEVSSFIGRAPKYFSFLKDQLVKVLQEHQVPLPDNWEQASALVWEKVQEWLPAAHKLADPVSQIFGKIFRSTLGILSVLLHVLLVPVLAYYFLASFDRFREGAKELIPPYAREPALRKLGEIDQVLSGFVRGQLTICCILAVLYSIGFIVIRIDLAVVLGTLAGLLFIVPYVGTMIGVVGGSIMALAQYGDFRHVLYVVLWIGAVQLVEAYVLTPRIVGQATGLHPVAYILALIIGAQLLGFVGMLIAIPVAAILKVLLKSGIEFYLKSDVYQDRKLGE